MISGLDLNATIDYVLKDDKENPTVWKLGIIPSSIFSRIASDSGNEIEKAYKILSISLKGWDNFSIPYKTVKQNVFGREMDVVCIEILDTLNIKQVGELSSKVMEINQITEPERKNS